MQKIFDKIIESSKAPSRQDIADLLSSIAPAGEQRELKAETLARLFQEAGHADSNIQGHGIDLESWGEF